MALDDKSIDRVTAGVEATEDGRDRAEAARGTGGSAEAESWAGGSTEARMAFRDVFVEAGDELVDGGF